ncbi:MAG: entericidin EcnA/B family protein [Lachnospiraceae bacterium]|nr:entericidin EcnA/B family protein [Lachnospiraceae bacterium]
MKRLRLFSLSVIVVSAIVLAGCGNKSGTNESTKQSGNTEKTSVSVNDTEDTIESLINAVDEVTKKADSAIPSDNKDEKQAQFIELKDEIDTVDHRLDKHDDYIENLYKRGEISYDDYRSQEKQLDELEDKLDASEDKLEFNFGIDD